MPIITIQKPFDQPTGRNRLINEIQRNLLNPDFSQFRLIVAFAKLGPFLRLENLLQTWRNDGKTIDAIFGIDEKGTTIQALEHALDMFTNVYIVNLPGNFSPTFHPKIYIFSGQTKSIGYIGSNNFTVGGLESNFESLVKIELNLPDEDGVFQQFINCWDDTIQFSRQLDQQLLSDIKECGLIIDERVSQRRRLNQTNLTPNHPRPVFPLIRFLPPSSIPRQSLPARPIQIVETTIPQGHNFLNIATQALVIQIDPHHNGEVFLSKRAIDQNPDFFGFPFTGETIPKKPSNPSYPQRIPDPKVNIQVLNNLEIIQESLSNFSLNTVYYDVKSELRITMPPNIIRATPPYSIMIMASSLEEKIDYDIQIIPPGSQLYTNYLAVCNQVMPSGGKTYPRKFGWI